MSGGGQIHCRGQAASGDLASAALTVTCGTAMSWCSCTAAAMALTMRVAKTFVFAPCLNITYQKRVVYAQLYK
jgi:hypothetical protein